MSGMDPHVLAALTDALHFANLDIDRLSKQVDDANVHLANSVKRLTEARERHDALKQALNKGDQA